MKREKNISKRKLKKNVYEKFLFSRVPALKVKTLLYLYLTMGIYVVDKGWRTFLHMLAKLSQKIYTEIILIRSSLFYVTNN